MSDAVYGLTPESLIDGLIQEIAKLAKDIHFYNKEGEERELNLFRQMTPLAEGSEEIYDSFSQGEPEKNPEETDPSTEPGSEFPYCVVKMDTTKVTGITEKRSVDIILEVGLYYDKPDRQYQHSMLTLFERIQKRFLTNPIFGAAECTPDMVFAVSPNDEETAPYYFGGAALRFLIPNYEREDDFS